MKLLMAFVLLTTPAWAYLRCSVDNNETYHYRLDFSPNGHDDGVVLSMIDNKHQVAYWKIFLAGSDGDYSCRKCLAGAGMDLDATLTINWQTDDFVFRIWDDKTIKLLDAGKCA